MSLANPAGPFTPWTFWMHARHAPAVSYTVHGTFGRAFGCRLLSQCVYPDGKVLSARRCLSACKLARTWIVFTTLAPQAAHILIHSCRGAPVVRCMHVCCRNHSSYNTHMPLAALLTWGVASVGQGFISGFIQWSKASFLCLRRKCDSASSCAITCPRAAQSTGASGM